MHLPLILLIVNVVSTWFMTGLIWFVQIVHYPLFDSVGLAEFQTYVEKHRQMTSLVVVGPMIIEITTALALALVWKRGESPLLWVCFAMVVAIWLCTATCSIPCHAKLCGSGYSAPTHQWLVTSNWLRTILWSARAAIMAFIVYRQMAEPLSTASL